jgi:uncharacterized membrane protein YphA (DoxX/SURF4 family)
MKMAFKSIFFDPAQPDALLQDLAYTLFRVYCGISIALGAGLSKVFHKIDEQGGRDWHNLAFGVPDWFVKQVGEVGFTFISPTFWAYVAVYGEFIGGLLIAVGLFTRISALQLAFQFFVVSFIWYAEPEFFGMYYQQLIFWSFVLISVRGGGRFSVEGRQQKRSLAKGPASAALFLLAPVFAFSQNSVVPQRVSFSISNPALKSRAMDIRYMDPGKKTKQAGYGYELGGLSSHAVNMPVGTRVYKKSGDRWQLLFVVSASDDGRKFDVTKTYDINREQWLQAARDEMDERVANLEAAQNDDGDVEKKARENGLEMVTFQVAGKSLFSRPRYVRAQLPFDPPGSSTGFSQKLGYFSRYKISYPAGTKLFLCDGPYWKGGVVKETLVLEVDAEKQNYLIRI